MFSRLSLFILRPHADMLVKLKCPQDIVCSNIFIVTTALFLKLQLEIELLGFSFPHDQSQRCERSETSNRFAASLLSQAFGLSSGIISTVEHHLGDFEKERAGASLLQLFPNTLALEVRRGRPS